MANKSDKRIAAENAATLRLLKYGTAITQVCRVVFLCAQVASHVIRILKKPIQITSQGLQLLLFFFFQSQRTRSHITLYALTSLPSLFLTFQLVSMGSPRLSPTGALLSAGDDLSQAGLTQYMMDIVFVTWAAQILACAWSRAWWIYASVRVHAGTVAHFSRLPTIPSLTTYPFVLDTRFCSLQALQDRIAVHLPLVRISQSCRTEWKRLVRIIVSK